MKTIFELPKIATLCICFKHNPWVSKVVRKNKNRPKKRKNKNKNFNNCRMGLMKIGISKEPRANGHTYYEDFYNDFINNRNTKNIFFNFSNHKQIV
jgi:hypothetical protein